MSVLTLKVSVLPYCGWGRLSHQFPVEVVVAIMVETLDVEEVGGNVSVDTGAEIVDVADDVITDVEAEVVGVVAQDAISIVATINMLELSHTNLFFNCCLHFAYNIKLILLVSCYFAVTSAQRHKRYKWHLFFLTVYHNLQSFSKVEK